MRFSIYYLPESYTRVNIYGRLSLPRSFVFKFERLNILLALIDHPSQKLWSLNLSYAAKFNFECLNILCARIEHPSEKLWPFNFLETFRCSISSVSIYHEPKSYTWIKSYGRPNLMSFLVQIRASRYIIGLNRTSEWNVMAVLFCFALLVWSSCLIIIKKGRLNELLMYLD